MKTTPAERAELLERHQYLLHRWVRSIRRAAWEISLEDLYQEAARGFLEGIEAYDPARGAALSTCARYYVWRRIHEAIDRQHVVRYGRRYRKRLDDRPVHPGKRMSCNLTQAILDHLAAPARHIETTETRVDLRRLLERADVSDRQAQVLALRYGPAELTYKEIGVRLGITKQGAQQLHDKALAALREALDPRLRGTDDWRQGMRRAVWNWRIARHRAAKRRNP